MADENDELVCSVLLDKKYDFVVVVSKSRTIGELRAEIDNVVREVYPEFRGGQVSRVENLRGSILPDRYKAGTVLGNESRIICYSSDRPKPVVGKRVPVVEKCVETVTSINRKGNSDDDEDDSDVEDGSCYSVGEESDNRDDSMVNGLDNSQQATAKKATCYTPKSARDARVSVSTSKSKRRALSTTLRGTQSNLPPSATDRKNRSTGNSDFPSLAGNLPRCRIKIRKLPLCIKHGRNLKVVQHKTCHGNNKRSEHRDVMCNRGSNFGKREHRQEKESDSTVPQKEVYLSTVKDQRIQKTKNTRIKDHYADIEGDIESGAELLNDKRRNLVNSLSGTVKRHLGSKNGISKRFPKRAKVQRRSYVDTSAQESSREDHDDCDGLLTENRNNSDVLNRSLRQSSQSLIEDATTKNDNDTDGDKDDDDDESDDLTPLLKRKARLTVAEVYSGEEGDVISFVAGETAMPELDIQRGAGCKEKGEISWKGKKNPTGGTNSIEESLTQNINNQIEKQVSSEKDVGISPKQCRSPKKNLLSKKSLPLSKSKGAVESSKQKTDDTLGNETGDNLGERQLRREINETSRLSTVPMKFKSHSERLVNIELSEGKYSGVGADDASGIVVEESRELVTERNAESTGNTNDNASVDETRQEREANNVSQTDEEAEEKDKESTPMYLTPIKKGEQIAWLKDSSRTADSEQMGDEYEDFMKRLEMSDCNTSSDETKRSKTENSPPLSSETDKESENNEEKGQESIESRTNGGRKSTKKKKRSQRKNTGLEGNEDTFVTNVGQVSVSDKTIMRNKTMEENLELEFNSSINKRSQQKHRKLEEDIDTMAESVNEETVGERRIISEETMEGNVELELTPQSPSEKRSTQKQRKVQMNKDRLVENVNEETVGDITTILEKTTKGDGRFKSTSQSPIKKKRSEQKPRKLQDGDTLVENVIQEIVGDGRIISKKSTERNLELDSTPQSPTEKRSKQKQRKLQKNEDPLVERDNEETVGDITMISEKTTEGDVELELTPQIPTEKRSEQKQGKLENEHSLVENVGEDSACNERIISKETTEGNGELEVTPLSPTEKNSKQKQRKLEDEHSLVENVGEEGACDGRIISKETTEGNGELEVTPKSPTEKESKQKRRKLEDEHSLVENVGEESACDERTISKETTEGNGELELTPQSPTEKKSKQKRRKLEDEHSLVENVGHESVRKTTITSKKRVSENVELECATEDHVNNKNNIRRALKRKTSKGDFQCHLLKESGSQALVGMETPKKKAREEGSCEDQRNDNNKKTHDGKTGEGANSISDGHKEGNQKEILKNDKKKKREKRKKKNELSGTESSPESTPTSCILEKVESSSQSKDKQNERMKREFGTSGVKKLQISNRKANKESNCDLLQTEQESQAFHGEEKLRKKDRYREEKHGEDDEKSHERKTSNQMDNVNRMSDQVQKEIYEQKSNKKKKEKRRKSELNSMESAAKLPSPLTLKTVTSDSLDDSGYSENGHNKSKQHEQCRPEQVESVQQLHISKKRKASTNQEKETLSGQELPASKPDNDFSQQKTNSKKKSKTSLSLLDLALDDTAEQGNSNKAGNRKTVQSEGRPVHQMGRHFRQMPKGFLHSAKIRRTASQSTILVRRKPRTNPKANVEMTAKDKDLVISGMSFEQLLDDESFWTT